MNLYFRFFVLLLRTFFKKKDLDLFAPCHTRFRVNLLDLDLNLHMNNGRYLSIMDIGRTDLMLRSGVFGLLFNQGYYPVVVSESIRFKSSLELFQKFELITVLESWDERDLFMSQKFIRNGSIVAEGFLKGRFKKRGRKGSIPTAELFSLVGLNFENPNLSKRAMALNVIEKQLGN